MASLEELRNERIKKKEKLEDLGLMPYPASSKRSCTLKVAVDDFSNILAKKKSLILAGRVMSLRQQGALIFFDLYDGSGRFQGLIKKDDVEDLQFETFSDLVDIGDFIEVTGTLFETKRGEKTVAVSKWMMLTKSLRPLPDKHHGLRDQDERFRKRYLDILFDAEVRDSVEKRALFWSSVRGFLTDRGFIEVETPVLETTTGGADARPFETFHNALDMGVYLRISAGELWQKRLMVAGFEKTFEIGRIFRNEGMSAEHLQDYTQMECYSAYMDFEQGMEFATEFYRHIAKETFGTLKFNIHGFDVDLGSEWKRYDYADTIIEYTGVDINTATFEEVKEKLKELKISYDTKGFNKVRAIDNLWKFCRKKIAGPGFLVGIPTELSPLAKKDHMNPDRAQKFHPLIGGSELGTGYSELNDPQDQAERFAVQSKMREQGDSEAQMYDHDFVEALEYGMPPTFGFGMSERVFSFFLNKPVREAQIFPLMKPKSE
jgi:lysyl-tRNA synthetase, class II